jgi:hypothetical protein
MMDGTLSAPATQTILTSEVATDALLAAQAAAAHAAFARGAWRAAATLFEDLAEAPAHRATALTMLGRLARREGRPDLALVSFSAALEAGDTSQIRAIETVQALAETKQIPAMRDALLGMIAIRPDLAAPEIDALLPAAHLVYLEQPASIMPFYRRASLLGLDDYLVELRLAEADEAIGDLPRAASRLDRIRGRLDHWGSATLARVEAGLGRLGEAAEMFETIIAGSHAALFIEQYIDCVLSRRPEAPRIDRLRRRIAELDLPAERTHALGLRLALLGRDLPAACALLEQLLAEGAVPGKWQLVQLLYLALDHGDPDMQELVASLLTSDHCTDPDALEALVNRAMMRRDFDAAARLLGCLASLPGQDRSAVVGLKRFELACYRNDMPAARRLAAELGPLADASAEALPSLYRFHAEDRAWGVILEDALARLDQPFDFAALGDLVVRAARNSGRRAEALAALSDRDLAGQPGLARLFVKLGIEQLLAGAAEDALDLLGRVAALAEPADLRRLDAFRRTLPLPPALAVDDPVAIFLCANRPYLPGTLVAVTSLLMRNPELAARAEIVLCADTATLPLATALIGPAVTALGARLAPMDAGALVGEAPLESRYGLFTGGHALAVEAYWRIYVARHLARERWHRFAIYLDSDVAVGPRFLDLLDQPMPAHACLLARPEVDRAEVRHAADKHGLPQGSYFNSGVLMFDLHHPETLPRLEAAIRIAETESGRLVFQDQCALNIAFAGASAPLDEAFNRFLAPDASAAGLDSVFATAGVVHFLDRPKPWDPMHTGPTAQLWLEQWQAASAFVPAPALAAALATAFA